MKNFVIVGIIVFGSTVCIGQTSGFKLADLDWMAGCWESVGGDAKKALTSEQWMKPEGGMMIGMGRTVRQGRAVDYEFMRIEQRGPDIVFVARPKANKEDTEFKMIRLDPGGAVFENAAHDFPQRVIYRKTKDGNLSPRIEGTINGKARATDFPMIRARCGN